MNILISNDDGIQSKGIAALTEVMTEFGDVHIVAPLGEKSACGHGITVHSPIRVVEHSLLSGRTGLAVDGTPADCVKLALTKLFEGEIDWVVSGVNRGPNLGTDVYYSGTVAAAMEGVIQGIPAIAFSLCSFSSEDFSASQMAIRKICKAVLKNGNLEDTMLNVNIPNAKYEEIKGYKITRLGIRKYINNYEHRLDPRGMDYYWLNGQLVHPSLSESDIDINAIRTKYISITPLPLDQTSYNKMSVLEALNIGL